MEHYEKAVEADATPFSSLGARGETHPPLDYKLGKSEEEFGLNRNNECSER